MTREDPTESHAADSRTADNHPADSHPGHPDDSSGEGAGTDQVGSAASSLGSQGGGIGLGGGSGSASSVDRTGSSGYSSTEGTPMGSLGGSVDSDQNGTDRD